MATSKKIAVPASEVLLGNGRPTVPATIDEARGILTGVDALAKATEWFRAAIVYAFTKEGVGQGSRRPRADLPEVLSFKSFAALGFAGLSSHHTVARYHRAWQTAIDAGDAKAVEPGKSVTLPNREWEMSGAKLDELSPARKEAVVKAAESHDVGASKVADIVQNKKAAQAAIEADPDFADAMEEALEERDQERYAESLERIADNRSKQAEATDESSDFIEMRNELAGLRRKARNASLVAGASAITKAEYLASLNAEIDKVRAILDLIQIALSKSAEIDWDAAAVGLLSND